MQKVFIANEDFEKEYSRSRAKGHTSIKVDDDVAVSDSIRIVTEGTTLAIKKDNEGSGDEVFTIPCKEFGLTNYGDVSAKISVIFCDNGWMLVTLLQGALVLNLDGSLLMPTVGDVASTKVVKEDIFWVDAEKLLSYSKYFSDTQARFIYDIEFVFEVSGQYINGMTNFSLKPFHDEDVDLSLGYIAQYEQALENKKNAKDAKKMVSAMLNKSNSEPLDFDDDDEYVDEDYEEEGYDEEDDGVDFSDF
jgi:hypothetical protein